MIVMVRERQTSPVHASSNTNQSRVCDVQHLRLFIPTGGFLPSTKPRELLGRHDWQTPNPNNPHLVPVFMEALITLS